MNNKGLQKPLINKKKVVKAATVANIFKYCKHFSITEFCVKLIDISSSERPKHVHLYNGWKVCWNGTTSVPKSVLSYVVDKVKLLVLI